jgi:hypothetical protein
MHSGGVPIARSRHEKACGVETQAEARAEEEEKERCPGESCFKSWG